MLHEVQIKFDKDTPVAVINFVLKVQTFAHCVAVSLFPRQLVFLNLLYYSCIKTPTKYKTPNSFPIKTVAEGRVSIGKLCMHSLVV